ncbi:ankyrin repeat domain-containing protein [Aspergillus mulundensis]|uniref:Uncharacterized protein n=1 Tax=Aspergillus mulundensis TaxID=1810919 RepID=A0A3D8SII9_9EURO|nr:hypothetical protein DSM5745_02748 [Aspergillus mulundensis]RDW86106.1 hypothetical protein DSM5745_02748 [Aspergillus mulundensis]
MVDPLSVAASAAGLISLGIESCKTIVHYCSHIHGCNEDVDAIALKAGGLLTTLQSLAALLDETDQLNPKVAADIREKILQNQQWVEKINDRISKLSVTAQGTGLGERLRVSAKKATYPFNKDTLLGTLDLLQGLQMNLHTALLALQIQHASAIARQAEVTTRMETLVRARLDQLDSTMGRMTLAISNATQQKQLEATYPTQGMSRRSAVRATCTCLEMGVSSLESLRLPRACPRHRRIQTKARARVFRFASAWLGLSVEATISIITGGNGVSVCPTLRVQSIVMDDSPGFELVRTCPPLDSTTEEISQHYHTIVQKLQLAFDQGYASPYDRLEDGRTLLHVACQRPGSVNDCLLKYLVNAGCPINEPNSYSDTPLSQILCNWNYHRGDPMMERMAITLVELGALVQDEYLVYWQSAEVLSRVWSHYEETSAVSNLVDAILSHSRERLQRALEMNHERDLSLLYRLCLSWADGIGILHETGKAISAEEKSLLLDEAVQFKLPEAALALVNAGAPVTPAHIFASKSVHLERDLFTAFLSQAERLSELVKTHLPPHIQASLGIQEGQWLDRKAAEAYAELNSCGVQMDENLRYTDNCSVFHNNDLTVSQMQRLYEAGFRDMDSRDDQGYTPVMLTVSPFDFSPYDSICRNVGGAQWLVDKGASLDNERPDDRLPARHIIALNLAARLAGRLRAPLLNGFDEPLETIQDILSLPTPASILHCADIPHVAIDDKQVGPPCFCLRSGSCPLHLGLRYIIHVHYHEPPDDEENNPWEWAQTAFEMLLDAPQIAPTISNQIIRLITFTDIQLTHTCYGFERDSGYKLVEVQPFDQDDAAEIHEEENAFIEELEGFVPQLQREFEAMQIPLWGFIQTHWCARMREHLLEQGETVASTGYGDIRMRERQILVTIDLPKEALIVSPSHSTARAAPAALQHHRQDPPQARQPSSSLNRVQPGRPACLPSHSATVDIVSGIRYTSILHGASTLPYLRIYTNVPIILAALDATVCRPCRKDNYIAGSDSYLELTGFIAAADTKEEL